MGREEWERGLGGIRSLNFRPEYGWGGVIYRDGSFFGRWASQSRAKLAQNTYSLPTATHLASDI